MRSGSRRECAGQRSWKVGGRQARLGPGAAGSGASLSGLCSPRTLLCGGSHLVTHPLSSLGGHGLSPGSSPKPFGIEADVAQPGSPCSHQSRRLEGRPGLGPGAGASQGLSVEGGPRRKIEVLVPGGAERTLGRKTAPVRPRPPPSALLAEKGAVAPGAQGSVDAIGPSRASPRAAREDLGSRDPGTFLFG